MADPHPTREQKDTAARQSRMDEIRSGQLALFMSAPEIKELAQPQHGDMPPVGLDPSNPEHQRRMWDIKLQESKDPDFRRYHPETGEDLDPGRTTSHYEHLQQTGGPATPVHLARGAVPEHWGVPLDEDIPLSVAQVPGQQAPIRNSWTVAGGGHRIAAMSDINPDLPLHVEHHESPIAAEGINIMQQLVQSGADPMNLHHVQKMAQFFRSDKDFEDAWLSHMRGRRYD